MPEHQPSEGKVVGDGPSEALLRPVLEAADAAQVIWALRVLAANSPAGLLLPPLRTQSWAGGGCCCS